jgi:hypothetical protein
MSSILLFFTTSGCHLCEDAQVMLNEVLPHADRLRTESGLAPLQVHAVEISEEAALVEHYGSKIPVLVLEESARELAWPFDRAHLFGFLSGFTQ